MGPATAIKTGFAKSFQFTGRASRSEFWWLYVSTSAILYLVPNDQSTILILIYAVFLFPRHAVAVQRMKDQERWVWEILILSPILATGNFIFAAAYEDGLFTSQPEIFLTLALIWLALYSRAFWILTGPTKESNLHDSQNEVRT